MGTGKGCLRGVYEGPKVDNSIFCHLTVEKQNKRFRQKIRFYIFSYIGGPKVDMSYSDFLLAEK